MASSTLAGCSRAYVATDMSVVHSVGSRATIWQGDSVYALRRTRIVGDSLQGSPEQGCDSCRISIPLATIDSLETRQLDPVKAVIVGAAVLTGGLALFVAAVMPRD